MVLFVTGMGNIRDVIPFQELQKCRFLNFMLKQSLQQKLAQKLSPQQIKLMKLIQLPTIELEQKVKDELEENPAIEEVTDREFRYFRC